MKKAFIYITLILIFLLSFCKREDLNNPSLDEIILANVSINSVDCVCKILSDGSSPITDKGFCWNTLGNPTITDNLVIDTTETDSISVSITGLETLTKYYLKAFAKSNVGTTFSQEVEFTTIEVSLSEQIADIEGNKYNTIKIGNQYWMSENLRTSHFNNGNIIETTHPVTKDISEEFKPIYQWVYNGNNEYLEKHGRLYTWHVVNDSRNVCPEGWHVPDDDDIGELIQSLGGIEVGGGKLKENGITNWQYPNIGADNSSKMSAIPSGRRILEGTFEELGYSGYWWTTVNISILEEDIPIGIFVTNTNTKIGFFFINDYGATSIRCVKD